MQPVKILVTASTFPRHAGDFAPRFILDICKSIESQGGFECIALAPHSEGSSVSEIMEGIRVRRFRYMYPPQLQLISGLGMTARITKRKRLIALVPLFLLMQLGAVIKMINEHRPRVLLAYWVIPQGLVAAIVKSLYPRLKVIIVAPGGDAALISRRPLLRSLGRFILGSADRVIAVSSNIRDRISGLLRPGKQIPVISMGVHHELFMQCREKGEVAADREGKSLLFIGRLEEKKGIRYLLTALSIIAGRHPDVTLTVVGEGTQKEELKMIAGELSVEHRVVFEGAVEYARLPALFERAMMFIVPSVDTEHDVEGLPTVILDAFAAKVPVVATDAGGIRDAVEDQVTGVVVRQRDPDDLARQIVRLMEDGSLRSALAANAFDRLMRDFTYPKIGEKYRRVIRDVLAT